MLLEDLFWYFFRNQKNLRQQVVCLNSCLSVPRNPEKKVKFIPPTGEINLPVSCFTRVIWLIPVYQPSLNARWFQWSDATHALKRTIKDLKLASCQKNWTEPAPYRTKQMVNPFCTIS